MKVTFKIPTQEIEALRAIAARQGITLTAAIRRAIGLDVYVSALEAKGGKLLIESSDGSISRIIRR